MYGRTASPKCHSLMKEGSELWRILSNVRDADSVVRISCDRRPCQMV